MNITKEFWDFIEANVPNYHTREDVLRQSYLQMFIDHGDDTHVKGITREEAIRHRDSILFRLYTEAIDAFTRKTHEQKELDDKLDAMWKSDAACERLGVLLIDETSADSESLPKVGRKVIEAYQSRDCDAMLVAICGWTMKSLAEKSE